MGKTIYKESNATIDVGQFCQNLCDTAKVFYDGFEDKKAFEKHSVNL
jgi:hypothetical protein